MKLKRGRNKKGRDNKGTVCEMQKKGCNRRKSARVRKEWNPVFRMQDRKEETIVELESGGTPYRGKGTTEQYVDRSSKRCSKRGGQAKRYQENIQNTKRSIVKNRSREDKYI